MQAAGSFLCLGLVCLLNSGKIVEIELFKKTPVLNAWKLQLQPSWSDRGRKRNVTWRSTYTSRVLGE